MRDPTGYEKIARFRGGEVLASARRVVVIGTPDDAIDANGDSLHNCDAMGCGQSHVVAIVDRPAQPTAVQPPPPPVPDLDALDRAAKTTSDRGVFVEDGAIYAYDGDVCFRVGSAENAAAEGDVAAAIVTTLDAAPHLIAEARAAVALRQELAEVAHMLAVATSRYDACVVKLTEAKRLGLKACDQAGLDADDAIRAALEAM